jgi:hypothetical protein
VNLIPKTTVNDNMTCMILETVYNKWFCCYLHTRYYLPSIKR